MATLDVGFEKLGAMRQRVIETIFNPLRDQGQYRLIAKGTSVAFDPSRVWLVERGEISVEYLGRVILTLDQGAIVGPWIGSVGPLSLVTTYSDCELVGFDHSAVGDVLSHQDALKTWCSFLAVSTSGYFAEFAEMKVVSVPPAPRMCSFSPGDVILREGDAGKEVFFLVEGGASVTVRGTPVGEVREEEIFGALAALTRAVRTATVTASKPTVCMAFSKDEFRDFLRANATLMEKIFEDFARALGDLNDSVVKASSTKWRNLF
jgi:CRP/FNR family cyclic AMP-dependent transcriptional regulator